MEKTGQNAIDLSQAKKIIEAPGYFIFSNGSVWSEKSNKIIKHTRGGYKGRYRKYALFVNGKYKLMYAHRLVMNYFGPPKPDCKSEVNHIDGDTTNNELSNLEWVSSSENTIHAIRTNLFSRVYLTVDQVKEIKIKFRDEPEYYGKVSRIADEYGVPRHVISTIKNNINWKHVQI